VGATRIYADHGSLIGSIGVLGPQLLFFNKPVATDGGLLNSGIVTQGGIEQTIISAGRGKDLGNPFRRPTEEEIASLTQGVEAEYAAFVEHVADNRRIDAETIRDRMGAMVFDNATAQQYGLIDGTASRGEAIARLAELAKVPKDYQVVRPGDGEGGMLRRLLSSRLGETRPPPEGRTSEAIRPSEICAPVRTPLAYYGDPSTLCR
jgi:protease-4